MLPGKADRLKSMKKPAEGGFFLASRFHGPRNLLRVAAQSVRELRKRADTARFGAVAPVLQLTHELVARHARALPQRRELCAHRVHGVKRARLRQSLLEVRALGFAQRFFVAVEPA